MGGTEGRVVERAPHVEERPEGLDAWPPRGCAPGPLQAVSATQAAPSERTSIAHLTALPGLYTLQQRQRHGWRLRNGAWTLLCHGLRSGPGHALLLAGAASQACCAPHTLTDSTSCSAVETEWQSQLKLTLSRLHDRVQQRAAHSAGVAAPAGLPRMQPHRCHP